MRADVAGARYRLQLMAVVESADTIREGCRLAGNGWWTGPIAFMQVPRIYSRMAGRCREHGSWD